MAVSDSYKKKVKELNTFLKKFKRLPKRGEPLGYWCSQQKYLFKKGKLSKEKAELLSYSHLLDSGDYNILFRANVIQQFLDAHQRFPFRDERVNGASIGEWWYKLQVQLEQFTTSDEVRMKIETLYPKLYTAAMNRKNKKFYEWIILLTQYQTTTGKIEPKNREKYMGRWLGDWCTRQRTLAKRGKLTEEKIKILREKHII